MQELKQRITYGEFKEWIEYLRMDQERNQKQEYYLAQIAAEVRRGWVKQPRKVKVNDFLLRLRDAQAEARMERSKKAWASVLNIELN